MLKVIGNRSVVRIQDQANESIAVECCPDILYRYVRPPYDERFLTKGEIRISPIDAYRHIEDLARQDPEEGSKERVIPNGVLPRLPMQSIGYEHPVSAFDNLERYEVPPSYCHCFSSLASQELALRFGSEDSKDPATCIAIDAPEHFLQQLDAAFRKKAGENGYNIKGSFSKPVYYKKGDLNHWEIDAPLVDPRLTKSLKLYGVEQEYRALWSVSAGGALESLNVTLSVDQLGLRIVRWDSMAMHPNS